MKEQKDWNVMGLFSFQRIFTFIGNSEKLLVEDETFKKCNDLKDSGLEKNNAFC